MARIYLYLLAVICLSSIGVLNSSAQRTRTSSNVKSKNIFTTPETDYFFDGSGYGESGLHPPIDEDDEGGDDDDDDEEEDDDDYKPIGSGLGPDFGITSGPSIPSSTFTKSTSVQKSTSPTLSTIPEGSLDVEPDVTKEFLSTEASLVPQKHHDHFAQPDDDNSTSLSSTSTTLSVSQFLPGIFPDHNTTSTVTTTSRRTSPTTTTTPVTTTIRTTTTTTATTTTTTPTTRTTTVRTTITSRRTTTTTSTTTTKVPARTSTFTFKNIDEDEDVITDEDEDINNKLDPSPPGKELDRDVSIDLNEEGTNEIYSNLPVMYRVSKLPRLAFINQPGVLAGIIAGAIVVLMSLVLFVMFVVYRLKRKSEPPYDRSTRSPAKAGYKKALDKDMYG